MPKTFQVLLKWRNFVKSGHSVTVNKLFTRQSKFVRLSLTGNHFEMTKFHSRNLSTCSSSEHSLFIDRNLNCSLHHRHQISRPFIGSAYPPLLTQAVMSPATMKQALVLNAGPVY